MNIGDVWIAVKANLKGFDTEVTKEATKTGDKAGKAMSKSMKKSVGSQMKGGLLQGLGIGTGLGVAGGVAAGVSAMTDEIFKSIDAASDLREAMSLSTQVFEDQQGEMEDWAKGAADAFGQSRREALNFAAGFGTAFKNVGFTLDDTADKAKAMTRLAADLGSAFDASSDEAATALRSGLLGESEPLRRFGVFLSEARVKAKALQMGLGKTHKELSNGEKVAARYALIMEDTADSQGMFGRDTESLADKQKELNAQLDDIRADIGEQLLPVMVDLATTLSDDVVPAVQDFIQTIKDNQWIFDFLGIAFDVATHPMDTWSIGVRRAGAAAEDQVEKIREMARATDEARHAALIAKEPIKAVGGAYTTMAGDAEEWATAMEDANQRHVAAVRSTRDAIFAALDDLMDGYYGRIGREEELLATRQELAALRRKESLGKLTDDEQARMLELQAAMDDSIRTMAEKGEIQSQEFQDALAELRTRARTAHGEEKKYLLEFLGYIDQVVSKSNAAIAKLKGINAAGGQLIKGDPHHERRATGGLADAGRPYLVNEATPRSEYFVPSVSGRVVTHAQAAQAIATGGGSGGNTYQYNIGRVDQETMPDVIRRLRRIDDVKRMRTIWS